MRYATGTRSGLLERQCQASSEGRLAADGKVSAEIRSPHDLQIVFFVG